MTVERKVIEITLEEMKEMVRRMELNGANICYLDIYMDYSYDYPIIDNIDFDSYDDNNYLDTMLELIIV